VRRGRIRWPNAEFMFEVADNGRRAPWSRVGHAWEYKLPLIAFELIRILQQRDMRNDAGFGEPFAAASLQAPEGRSLRGLSCHFPSP